MKIFALKMVVFALLGAIADRHKAAVPVENCQYGGRERRSFNEINL